MTPRQGAHGRDVTRQAPSRPQRVRTSKGPAGIAHETNMSLARALSSVKDPDSRFVVRPALFTHQRLERESRSRRNTGAECLVAFARRGFCKGVRDPRRESSTKSQLWTRSSLQKRGGIPSNVGELKDGLSRALSWPLSLGRICGVKKDIDRRLAIGLSWPNTQELCSAY
jgi:hypothetical protein